MGLFDKDTVSDPYKKGVVRFNGLKARQRNDVSDPYKKGVVRFTRTRFPP